MIEKRVRDYYSSCVPYEWKRLTQDAYHSLEYETTLHFLAKYLPQKGTILDAGGGPGRYTVELAKRGYRVALLDIASANLEHAKRVIRRNKVQGRVTTVTEGSIVDLSQFPDNTFDAVLCLGGPLSHVLDGRKGNRAVSELLRVCRRRAPLFVSVMGRLSVLVVELTMAQQEIEMPHFVRLRDTGDYLGGHGFTACHFFLPEELRDLFAKKGAKILELAGLEGISSHHPREVKELARDPRRWRRWLETHYRTCTHPSVVGLSEHMMIICRKS